MCENFSHLCIYLKHIIITFLYSYFYCIKTLEINPSARELLFPIPSRFLHNFSIFYFDFHVSLTVMNPILMLSLYLSIFPFTVSILLIIINNVTFYCICPSLAFKSWAFHSYKKVIIKFIIILINIIIVFYCIIIIIGIIIVLHKNRFKLD